MKYCPNPESDEPIFLLDKQIGQSAKNPSAPYIDGDEFARELLEMDARGKKRIEIRINSEGGNVKQGMSIYGAVLNTKTKVDTFCVGVAYSMAAVVFQAGRKRRIMDYGQLMYHEAYDPKEKKVSAVTDLINESLNTMISSRSWKDEAAVRTMMKNETFISAADALNADLCDEVIKSDELNRPRMSADARSNYENALEYVNKFLPIKTDTMNKDQKIALGLKEDATDAEVTAAINALNTAKADLTAKVTALEAKEDDEEEEEEDPKDKKKGKKSTKEMKALETKLDDVTNKLTAIEASEKTAQLAARKAEAKAKITGIINTRKLKLEDKVLNEYIAMGETDEANLARVVTILENMTVVNHAPKTPVKELNKKFADASNFPLIPGGNPEKNSPVGVEAGDTTDFINHVNSFDLLTFKKRAGK